MEQEKNRWRDCLIETLNSNVSRIPIVTNIYWHPLDRALYCADSASLIRVKDESDHWFYGHSGAYDKDRAVKASHGELLERILASRFFLNQSTDVTFHSYADDSILKVESAKYHTVRQSRYVGSTGLALHTNSGLAVEHGIREVVERHILCEFWYKDRPLFRFDVERINNRFRIEYFTTSNQTNFVLAVMLESVSNVMFCGSAVKVDLASAKAGARNEALLLSTQYVIGNLQQDMAGNKVETVVRYQSLLSGSSERIDFLNAKVADATNIDLEMGKVLSIEDLCESLGLPIADFYYAKLNSMENFVLYKAKSDACLSKEFCRSHFKNVLEDPFC